MYATTKLQNTNQPSPCKNPDTPWELRVDRCAMFSTKPGTGSLSNCIPHNFPHFRHLLFYTAKKAPEPILGRFKGPRHKHQIHTASSLLPLQTETPIIPAFLPPPPLPLLSPQNHGSLSVQPQRWAIAIIIKKKLIKKKYHERGSNLYTGETNYICVMLRSYYLLCSRQRRTTSTSRASLPAPLLGLRSLTSSNDRARPTWRQAGYVLDQREHCCFLKPWKGEREFQKKITYAMLYCSRDWSVVGNLGGRPACPPTPPTRQTELKSKYGCFSQINFSLREADYLSPPMIPDIV